MKTWEEQVQYLERWDALVNFYQAAQGYQALIGVAWTGQVPQVPS